MATYAQTIDTSGVVGSFSILNWQPLPGLKWMQCNWHWSIYASLIYVLLIFSVQRKMRSQDAFKLRKCLAVWNSALSLFSLIGAYFMLPELLQVLDQSFHHSVCFASVHESAQYWMWLFAISKIVELGESGVAVSSCVTLLVLQETRCSSSSGSSASSSCTGSIMSWLSCTPGTPCRRTYHWVAGS